jgi:hypothetical protein
MTNLGEVLLQAFLATISMIALIVIAINLLLTCGLLVVCIYYTQRLIGRFNGLLEVGLERGSEYSASAVQAVAKASEKVVQPVVWAEQKAVQIKSTGRSLVS